MCCPSPDELDNRAWKLKNIILVHVYVRSMEDFAAVNAVYKRHFDTDPPARYRCRHMHKSTHVVLHSVQTCIYFILFIFILCLSWRQCSIHWVSFCIYAGFVFRHLSLLVNCCRWTVCSMTGSSPWRKAASTRRKLCMSRACPTGLRLTLGHTAKPSG